MKQLLLTRLKKITNVMDTTVSWGIIACMTVMTATLIAQVFMRYVLNDSLSWGWVVPRLAFIWLVLLSIPLAFKYNLHVGIDLLTDALPAPLKTFFLRFNALAMAGLSVVIFYQGYGVLLNVHDQVMPGSSLSVGLFYYVLLVSQVHVCLHLAALFITGQAPTDRLSEL